MASSHLPISAHVRLTQLRRLKELRGTKDGLNAQQRAASDVVFSTKGRGGLNRLRVQAIGEMVEAGYLNEEVFMVLADPESPYSVLIEGLENVHDTVRAIIREAKAERKEKGKEQARDEYVQRLRRLIDATWAALAEGGDVSHQKNLLDFIDRCNKSIAEAMGIQYTRAGRKTTQHPAPEEQPEDEEETPAGDDTPNWEKEEGYQVDESND